MLARPDAPELDEVEGDVEVALVAARLAPTFGEGDGSTART
jgi:hypothetical protein